MQGTWPRLIFNTQKVECLLGCLVKVATQSHKGVFTNMILCGSASCVCAILARAGQESSHSIDPSKSIRKITAYQFACHRCRPSSPDGTNSVTRREWIAHCVMWPARGLAKSRARRDSIRDLARPFHCKSTRRRSSRDVISDSNISLDLLYT